jgi:hypothetical protein
MPSVVADVALVSHHRDLLGVDVRAYWRQRNAGG